MLHLRKDWPISAIVIAQESAEDDGILSRSPAAGLDICRHGRAVDGGVRIRVLGGVAALVGLASRSVTLMDSERGDVS